MTLKGNVNYIVSGLERSGTSMIMQMLHAGGLSVAFDDRREADENNPRGYYELEGGKIINRLMEETFPFDEYTGRFIKITAYGLKFLPSGNYKIIYSERNIEEILDSMEKMADINDEKREETRSTFLKLNMMIKNELRERNDVDVLFVNYNEILSKVEENTRRICDFLELPENTAEDMISVVDKRLYRQRRTDDAASQ